MNELLGASAYFGVFVSLLAYGIGTLLRKKWKLAMLNPILIAVVLIIVLLSVCHIDYTVYNEGAKYLSYLLTPATVCLAVPLGVLTSLTCVLAMAALLNLDHAAYVTLLPKSITTAIGMSISEELGGYVPITVAVILVTGILGNMFAEAICKLFKIQEPIAKGIAIGSASHAIGTAKAMELGDIEGAMSSLSIVVSGILPDLGANLFASFL